MRGRRVLPIPITGTDSGRERERVKKRGKLATLPGDPRPALCGVGRMIFNLSMCVGVIRNYKPEVHMLTWAVSETLVWFIV